MLRYGLLVDHQLYQHLHDNRRWRAETWRFTQSSALAAHPLLQKSNTYEHIKVRRREEEAELKVVNVATLQERFKSAVVFADLGSSAPWLQTSTDSGMDSEVVWSGLVR
jgi:hypothetical protein